MCRQNALIRAAILDFNEVKERLEIFVAELRNLILLFNKHTINMLYKKNGQ
jgi:hypothetical protein